MTDATKASAAPRRTPAKRNSTPQKVLSAGLATAACIGITGVMGVRMVEANAVEANAVEVPVAAPTTDLSGYAAQLEQERAALDAYRADLVATAKKLNRQVRAQASAPAATAADSSPTIVQVAKKPVKPPRQQAAAKPPRMQAPTPVQAPARQSNANTRSS